jgi:hypothetical protein
MTEGLDFRSWVLIFDYFRFISCHLVIIKVGCHRLGTSAGIVNTFDDEGFTSGAAARKWVVGICLSQLAVRDESRYALNKNIQYFISKNTRHTLSNCHPGRQREYVRHEWFLGTVDLTKWLCRNFSLFHANSILSSCCFNNSKSKLSSQSVHLPKMICASLIHMICWFFSTDYVFLVVN